MIAIALSGVAHAELDSFTIGDGHEGSVTVNAANTVLNYSAPISATVATGATSLTTGAGQSGASGTSTTGGSAAQTQFEANRLALVIQSSNYTGAATSGSQSDIDLSSSSVGRWELARISSVSGSIAAGMTVNFTNPLVNSYAGSGAQIVAVPEFTTVQINTASSWKANNWNGTSGGITAFLASGAVNMSAATSAIKADGSGFRGGQTWNLGGSGCTQLDDTNGGGKGEGVVFGRYPGTSTTYTSRGNIANAGGGGDCENAGGGGGGNGGTGGKGGYAYDSNRDVGGLGGTKLLYSAFDHALFGGGGGAGDANNGVAGAGGNGGGFVFMRAASLTGSGTISAVGQAGGNSAAVASSDGAGGGGAGGVVYARFTGAAACTGVSVGGGAGGNEQSTAGVHGPGGGGAGGRLVMQSASGTCPTNVTNGVAGTTTGSGNSNRGSGPTSSTDATSSGATEAVSGGGGFTTPTAAVSVPAASGYFNTTTPTITGTSSMALGTIRVTIDGSYLGSVITAADGSWSYAVSPALSTGGHNVSVQPVYYGAAGSATATRNFTIDTSAPTVSITGTTSPTASGTSQTATIAASDNVGVTTQTCKLDSGAATACTTSFSTGALAAGSHTITVVASDAAGNSTTQTATIVVDQTTPTVSITGLTSPTASGSSQTAAIAASDNVAIATQTCKLDSGAATACTTSFSTGALVAGTHTITVVATDTSGNATTQTATIVVDQTNPAVSISGLTSPTNSTSTQTATITASDNVALSTVTCKIDSGAATSCIGGSYATSTLVAGSHTLTVLATDTSGNTTTQTATIVVDQTNPALLISGLTSPTASGSSQTATITASDNVALSTVTCKVDSGAATSCIGGTYATGALVAGTHTITVVATDTAGNQTTQTATVVIDQTGPVVTISGLTSPTKNSTSQTATIAASDNVAIATQTCKLDLGTASTCTTSFATGTLAAGLHTITVVATDTSGNVTTQTANIVVDQTNPTVSISGLTSPTASGASQTATIAALDNVGLATQTCKLDSGTASACTTSFVTGALAAGTHTITVVATDTSGNQTTQSASIVIDQTVPTVSISGLTSPTSSSASQTATISANDNVAIASQTCKLDSGTASACTTSFVTGTLAAGTHTITVVATDTSGNSTTQTATIVVDQTAPTISISGLTSPTNSTSSQTATISASDNVAVATQTCKLDAGSPVSCTTSFATGAIAAGTHTITVVATDTAGNQTTQTATIVVDQTAPTISISGLTSPTNSTTSQTATISASDNVAIASQTCKLDSGSASACNASFATGAIAAGSHTITVVATDTAGNQTTQTATIVVDTSVPSVAITPPSSPTASSASQNISFTATDNGTVTLVECKLDSGAFAACTSPFATGTLAAGTHTVSVRATDNANNQTTQSVTIIVDQTAPAVTISALTSPSNSTTSQIATIGATDNVAVATVTCSLDSATPAACSGTYATGTLAAGTHTLAVTATDTSGNASTQTATIVIDTTAPTVTISGLTSPTNSTTSQTATIAASDNVAIATQTCKLDSGSASACTTSFATGALAAGGHTITVVATDTAGNVRTQTATIVVDQTAPTVTLTGLASPTASGSSQTATITANDNVALSTVTCKVDSGSVTSCIAGTYATGAFAAGSHTITVVATDTSGNQTTQTATVVIDQTAPSVSITGLTSPTKNSTSQTATIAASDNVAIATQTCKLDSGSATACTTSFATGTLAAGSHTITVVATDTSGNSTTQTATIIVDQTAPTVTISGLSSPTASSASQSATISANDNVAIANQTCKLDTGTAAACTTSFATGALAAGSHTITVVATDTSGNSTTQTATIIVDQTSPTISISGLTSPTASSASQTAAITASDNVGIATQTCKLDSGTATACTTSFATGALAAGSHTITVVATDTSGNQTTQSATIVVDQTPPSVSITGLTSPTKNSTSQTATIATSDNIAIASQTCKLDSGSATACTTSFATGVLTAGSHTITVVATDTSGNVTTQTATIVVDQTAPTVSISGLTSPTASSSSQTATIAASDNVGIATQTCKLDSGTAGACTTSFATGPLSAGTHTITVVATDTSGNVTTQTATIIVDQTNPTVSISGLTSPVNSTASQTATINANDNVGLSTVTCKIDSGAATSCIGGTYATGTLSQGVHTLTVVATDTSGNSTTQTTPINVDQQPPTISITGASTPTNSNAGQNLTIGATDNVAVSTVTCKVDSGTPISCIGGTFATGALAAGSHSVTVVATDTAGNVKTQSTTIVVDQTAPTLSISGLTSPTASSGSQTATINASDNGALDAVTCAIDAGSAVSCVGGTYATGTLAEGSHTLMAVATDTAGNTTTQTATIVVDQTAPTISISGLTSPTNATSSQTATISASDDVALDSQTCSLDSGPATSCTTSFATGSLAAGSHTVTVVATDTSGNSATRTATIVVDQTTPSVSIGDYVSPVNSGASQTLSITASDNIALAIQTCQFDSDAAVPCTSTFATGAMTAGTHTITVIATDTAGNTSTESATIIVDQTPPSVAISGLISPTASTDSQTATITASDVNGIVSVTCTIDAQAPADCSSGSFDTGALSDGAHTVAMTATDGAGNAATTTSALFVDATAPDAPTITTPSADVLVNDSSVALAGTAEPGAAVKIYDGATLIATVAADSNGDWSHNATLAEGSHTITATATDSLGNTGLASDAREIAVDLTPPPAPTITGGTSGLVKTDAAHFEFSANEPSGSLECDVDGAGYSPCTSPFDTNVADGPHTFSVRQVDDAGNSGTAATRSWSVDTDAPDAPSVTGPSAHSNNPESTISFTAGAGTDSLECSFNGAPATVCPSSPLSLGELPDGDYTFTVTAFDAAGNSASTTISWEVDTAAPAAPTITGGPIGEVASTSAEFTFSGAEAGGSFKCQLGSAPAVTCTSPFDLLGLADGTYSFHVRQIDAAGNVSPQAGRTWTVDTTPPPAPAVSGPSSPSGFTSATVTFSDGEPGVTFMCSVDGATAQPCASPLSLSGLSDGSHTVEVRAYDVAGNGSAPQSATWEVDHSLFTANIAGAPTDVVNTTSATLTLTATLPGSTFECSRDGAPFTSCSSPVSLSGLAEGDHTFAVRAINGAQQSAVASKSWTVDLTNPAVSIISPEGGDTTAPDTSITFSVSDAHALASLTCKLDSAAASPCASPLQLTNLTNGSHTLTIVATDVSGNSGSAVLSWNVDHGAPDAPQITQPATDIATSDTTPQISGSAEPGSTVSIFDGSDELASVAADGTGHWTWTPASPLDERAHVFTAVSTDPYGNASQPSEQRTITVDVSAPDAPSITSPAAGPNNDATPTVAGSAEPGSKVHVLVDGVPLSGFAAAGQDGNWSLTISPALGDGPHTISAIATDPAGNDSAQSADVTITTDTAAPPVSITSPTAAQHVASNSPSVIFTAESGATTRCTLDSGSYSPCDSPYEFSGLAEGSHTVSVEATDEAGNVATAVVTFVVDLTPPTASIGGGPSEGGQDNDSSPTFTLVSNEPGTFECDVDDSGYAPCTSPYSPALGSPLDGPHTISVRAIDAAGNKSEPQTRSWNVDTQAPAVPSIDHPADNGSTQDTTPTVSGDAGSAEALSHVDIYINGNLNGSTIAAADGSWSYTPASALGDNNYTFIAKARDAAGNVSAASNGLQIRVDASDPTAQITSKPASLTNSGQATFSFTADEPATFECRLDSGIFAPCSAPALLSGLGDGAHQFYVRATDPSGNVSPAVQWNWTIDTTPPVVNVSSDTPAAGLSPTFSFSSSESGTTYKCRFDGAGAFTTCSSPFAAPTLAAGNHTLELQFTDAAGNTGTKSVAFVVVTPVNPGNGGNGGNGGATTPTCPGSGDEPGIPANISVISVTSKKNQLKFVTSSDQFVLIRVSVFNGSKRVGNAVRPNGKGSRIVAIKTKRALPKNKTYVVKLSAITMSGGKSVAQAQLSIDAKGKAVLLGASGEAGGQVAGAVSCGPEKGAPKIKVKVATAKTVKVSVKKMTVAAKASDYAVAYFKVIQGGKTVARRVFVLQPNKNLKAPLKLLAGKKLAKGKAIVQITTATVDGVWQTFKKPITVN